MNIIMPLQKEWHLNCFFLCTIHLHDSVYCQWRVKKTIRQGNFLVYIKRTASYLLICLRCILQSWFSKYHVVHSFQTEAITNFGLTLRSVMHDKCYKYDTRTYKQMLSLIINEWSSSHSRVSYSYITKGERGLIFLPNINMSQIVSFFTFFFSLLIVWINIRNMKCNVFTFICREKENKLRILSDINHTKIIFSFSKHDWRVGMQIDFILTY